jgi:hypothetical protein
MSTNRAADDLVPPRVRDVDPSRLLMHGSPDGVLEPYMPREVDKELDKALASPGVVLLVYETNAGARRTAYEALLRNLPDAALIVDPDLNTSWDSESSADAVLWLDRRLSYAYNDAHGTNLDTVQGWSRSQARRPVRDPDQAAWDPYLRALGRR